MESRRWAPARESTRAPLHGRRGSPGKPFPDITTDQAENPTSWFAESARCWGVAASWSPNLRLGGYPPTLRQLGSGVRDACIGTVSRLDALRAPMQTAVRLSLLHASPMDLRGIAHADDLPALDTAPMEALRRSFEGHAGSGSDA